MSLCAKLTQYRRLRAPQEDRSALIDPPLEEAARLVEENVRLGAERSYDCSGRSLVELAYRARAELIREAQRHTSTYRDVPPAAGDPAGLIFMAGHQPQLFHPGVWWKNFALSYLAQQHGATAVNLRIDSDTFKGTAPKVPGGSVSDPRVERIRLDRAVPRIPYEERQIVDRELFEGFGNRAAEQIARLVDDPMIAQYWPMVLEHARRTNNLGAAVGDARHELEGRWGLQTLEVPQSRICESQSFAWFAIHLLSQISDFSQVHNDAVREYRRVNRIRSAAHPVPDLVVDKPWFEAPLWIWTADDPRRRRLFVRHRHDGMVLTDRAALEIELPLCRDGDAHRAVERWMQLGREGVKIRSRALITTLWARLALGDLFLHGIGGAKYDQVTDMLCARFFDLSPPGLMVFSATLHLPIARPNAANVDDARAIRQQLRHLVYHPEHYVDSGNGSLQGGQQGPAELVAAKRRWIDTPQTPKNARRRCRAIRQINEQLQPWVEPQRSRLLQLQEETARALEAQRILASREYAFCLYPEKMLREYFCQLLPKLA